MQQELIFLHGFMGHSSEWDFVREELQKCDPKLRTVAVDVGVATDWENGIRNLASEIVSGCILIGYSMGARIALGLANEYPQQIGGLVFVSGNPGLETDESKSQRLESDLELADQISEFKDAESVAQFLNQWYRQSVFETLPDSIRDDEIRRKCRFDFRIWPEILRTYSVARQPNFWPCLKELSVPTCVVAGAADEKYKQIALRMGEELANLVVTHTVAECGHIVHREKPEEFTQIIRNFVADLR